MVHTRGVGAGPKQAPAFRTMIEIGTVLKDIIRNTSFDLCSWDLLQTCVAPQTAALQVHLFRGDGQGDHDMPQLLSSVVAGYPDRGGMPSPTAITSEYSVTAMGIFIQLLGTVEVLVAGVKPQYPQPFGQFAEHAVDDKTLIRKQALGLVLGYSVIGHGRE